MDRDCDVSLLSPLTLAFVGDAVFGLLVRESLVCEGNCPVGKLHSRSVEQVCCTSQARAAERLLPLLSEREAAVYRRGRNAKPKSTPKNGNLADYHEATALEALFGYLYLSGEMVRIREFFDSITS